MTNSIEKKTRSVFDVIHREQLSREQTRNRLRALTTEAFLGVEEGFFIGKQCADIGCGSAVNGTVNLLNLGAEHVHAMDLDESILEPAKQELEPEYAGRYTIDTGSIFELPYPDEMFDFIECSGVIHHIENREKAVSELYRIIKKNGLGSIMVAGNGGLMHRLVFECLRDEYMENSVLQKFVDNSPEQSVSWLKQQINWLDSELGQDDSQETLECKKLLRAMANLVDEELMLTIKDRVLSPINRGLTPSEMESYLKSAGFIKWRRLSRRVPYNNIRKLLSPLYYHQDHELSQLFYGAGSRLHYLVEK
jgi:ubiquinone/menaquinone biosynthesis C-methylase UbiE